MTEHQEEEPDYTGDAVVLAYVHSNNVTYSWHHSMIELVGSEQQRQFGLAKQETLPRYCRECEVRFICNGGCPKDRILTTPDGEPGLNYLCQGFKAFFNHIDPAMRFMAGELKAQRPPANIMLHLAQQEAELARRLAQTGRNDPCPCGSGKKFKQCHGRR